MQTGFDLEYTYIEDTTTSGTEYFIVDTISGTVDVSFIVVFLGIMLFLYVVKMLWR